MNLNITFDKVLNIFFEKKLQTLSYSIISNQFIEVKPLYIEVCSLKARLMIKQKMILIIQYSLNLVVKKLI